jgi:hypothetical protein
MKLLLTFHLFCFLGFVLLLNQCKPKEDNIASPLLGTWKTNSAVEVLSIPNSGTPIDFTADYQAYTLKFLTEEAYTIIYKDGKQGGGFWKQDKQNIELQPDGILKGAYLIDKSTLVFVKTEGDIEIKFVMTKF